MPNIRGKTAKSDANVGAPDASANAPRAAREHRACARRTSTGVGERTGARDFCEVRDAFRGKERKDPAKAKMGQRVVVDGSGGRAARLVLPDEARRAPTSGSTRRPRILPRGCPKLPRSHRWPIPDETSRSNEGCAQESAGRRSVGRRLSALSQTFPEASEKYACTSGVLTAMLEMRSAAARTASRETRVSVDTVMGGTFPGRD